MKKILISNNKVIIKKFIFHHINNEYINWLNDDKINQYSEHRHYKHTKKTAIKYCKSRQNNDHYKMLFMALHDARKNCHHFGNMHAYIDEFNKSADLSIMIGDLNYHNIGYGRICWLLGIKYLFDNLKLRLVTAKTMSENKNMINLMKKSRMSINCKVKDFFLNNRKKVDLVIATKFNNKFKIK